MKKPIDTFTELEWNQLESTGLLWELYPEAPTNWYELKRSYCEKTSNVE